MMIITGGCDNDDDNAERAFARIALYLLQTQTCGPYRFGMSIVLGGNTNATMFRMRSYSTTRKQTVLEQEAHKIVGREVS